MLRVKNGRPLQIFGPEALVFRVDHLKLPKGVAMVFRSRVPDR
jgi:hypothetical protein